MKKAVLAFALIFLIAAFFGLRWAILTGRTKHRQVDAEYHADQNLRAIYHAQREYYVNHEFLGFPCAFSTLTASPDQLLDSRFSSGNVDGYTFTFSNCKHEENIGFNGNVSYSLTATPVPIDGLTLRTFCMDDNINDIPRGEVVFEHPHIISSAPGSTACDQMLSEPAR